MGVGTRNRSGILVVVLIVGALVVVGGNKIGDIVGGWFGAAPVRCTDAFCVPDRVWSKVKHCTPAQVLSQRRCGEVKFVVINAEKMPFIARNIKLAWAEGRPAELHRESSNTRAKRNRVCGKAKFQRTYPKGSCDEYPFASSIEGGNDSRIEEVHETEQDCQGGTISSAYQKVQINEGDEYLVVISHPESIASQAWRGGNVQVTQCLG